VADKFILSADTQQLDIGVYRGLPPFIDEDKAMQLFAIIRRDGFTDGPTLESAAARSTAVGETMPDDIRWIRSYVLNEESGALGTVCIYEASSEQAIRDHAARADLPVTEILPIGDTVIVRPDPEAAAASA
jgi:hypothetical protein